MTDRTRTPSPLAGPLRRARTVLESSRPCSAWVRIKSATYHSLLQRRTLVRNQRKHSRLLEIGPGRVRIDGFETLNLYKNRHTDYVIDASKALKFPDNTFDVIYASHVLEHIPWYVTERVLREWIRVLKPGGALEVWVPDGLKIARAFCDAEEQGDVEYQKDGWFRFNEEKDSAKWFCGRMYSYGDGSGRRGHHNYHYAAFSERYLRTLLQHCGLRDIRRMCSDECRGHDHGWINLGVAGVKAD
jgi:SAM-dependent methyltransferase